MVRTVKHFSLHRIAGTELRIVADVDRGVLPLIQVEETVIREYVRHEHWPHRWVTLFILEDLQPLARQLRLGANPPSLSPPGPALGHPMSMGEWSAREYRLSSERGAALDYRPVVNIYDLADLASCNIFVNQRVMVEQGYWDDPLAQQGLLAHEHAHPQAENETVQASRRLRFQISDFGFRIEDGNSKSKTCDERSRTIENRKSKIALVLTRLAEKLCLDAPREILANEVTIQSGFAEALLHLDLHNVGNAGRSVAGRRGLTRQLQQEVTQGNLTPAGADLLLLVGDMSGYLDLALEIAPFYRAGRAADARVLETALETTIFPRLDAMLPQAFTSLRDQYIALRTDMTLPELITWGAGVLETLTGLLSEKGLALQCHLWMVEE